MAMAGGAGDARWERAEDGRCGGGCGGANMFVCWKLKTLTAEEQQGRMEQSVSVEEVV